MSHTRKKTKLDRIKEILVFLSTLFAISILTFMLVKISPGDPAVNYLRASHIAVTNETINNARVQLGLDKPLITQYTTWLFNALKGNLGTSYLKKLPVLQMIKKASATTFQMGTLSFVILLVFSTIFGIISAIFNKKWIDYLVQFFSFISASIPTFWLGYMLIIIFSVKFKILPVSGRGSFKHMILPCITLVTPLIGQTTLIIRKTILEEINQAHVTNAVIRGVKDKYIILNHLIRNSAIPVLTIFSSNILYLITGSVLIEEVFAWPGVGKMFVDAVQAGDAPLIQGSLLLFGVLAILINLITHEFIIFLDPHLRVENKEI